MKILLFAPRFHTNLEPIVRAFVENSAEVKIVVWTKSIAEIRDIPTVEFLDIIEKSKSEIFEGGRLKRLREFQSLIRNSINLITQSKDSLVFLRGEMSRFGIFYLCLIKILGLSKMCTVFTQYPEFNPKLKHLLWKLCVTKVFGLKYFSQVYVESETFTEYATDFAELSAFKRKALASERGVIPFALPLITKIDGVHNLDRVNPRTILLMSIIKDQERKGARELIDCLESSTEDSRVKWKLILIVQTRPGINSWTHNLKNYYSKSKVRENIEIYTNLSPTKVRDYLLSADLFVLNSTKEPASFSQLEAIMCGVPVLLNRHNGSSFFLPEGSGILKYSGKEELKRALLEGFTNNNELKRQVTLLRGELENLYSNGVIAAEWISTLEGD